MHTVPLMSRIELCYEIYKMSNFLNIFTTTLRFIIHVFQLIVKRIVLLSKLHLRVNDFFREKTLHMICLKLGLKVTNFQGTGP